MVPAQAAPIMALAVVIMGPAVATMGRAAVIKGTVVGIMAALPATMVDIMADIMVATMAGTNTTVATATMEMVTLTAFGLAAGDQAGGDRLIRIPDITRTIIPTHIMPRDRL